MLLVDIRPHLPGSVSLLSIPFRGEPQAVLVAAGLPFIVHGHQGVVRRGLRLTSEEGGAIVEQLQTLVGLFYDIILIVRVFFLEVTWLVCFMIILSEGVLEVTWLVCFMILF